MFTPSVKRATFGLAVALLALSSTAPARAQGLLEFLFGGPSSSGASRQDDNPRARITVTPRRHGPSASSGGGMVCVRLCDGYHFPLTAGVDKEQAAFACKLGCPGAETKVFRRQGDDINNAVADDRSIYKKLANASAFQKSSSATCGCFSTRVSSGPVYDDPTMKPGDVIIVDGKAMTLKPGATKPYDKTDYVEVERSRSFPASVRNMLRAKLQGAPIVARTERRERVRATATPGAPLSLSPSHTRDGLRVIMPSPYDGAPVETPPAEAPLKQAAVSGNSGAAPAAPLEPAAR